MQLTGDRLAIRLGFAGIERGNRLPNLRTIELPYYSSSTSSRFRIFPVAVIGNAERNSMKRGYL